MKHLNRPTIIATLWILTALLWTSTAQSQSVFISSGGGSGNWNDPASWTLQSGSSTTGYPVAGDTATITAATTLTVDSNAQCSALTINSAATLQFTSIQSILTVSNQLTTTGASNVDLSLGVLTVTGGMTINGASTVTINEGALTVIGLVLLNAPTTSTGNSLLDIEGGAFTCGGLTTITATTATRTAELRINAGAVSLAGGLGVASPNAKINFTGPGTLTLAGDVTIPNTASFIAGNGRVIYFGLPGVSQNVAALTYYRLVITGIGGGPKQISGAVSVTDSLTLLTDTLEINGGGSLTLSNGITIVRTAGQLLNAPVFAGVANLVYNDVSRDTTGPEMPTSGTTLQNLTISDISGIDLGANITVNDSLNLFFGPLWTDNYTLTVANPAGGATTDPAINRINGYVMGSLTRNIGTSAGLRIFPMGADSSQNYREFDLNYTTAPTASGTLTVMAIDSAAPAQNGIPLDDNSETIINVAPLYWQADAANGLSGGTYTVTATATGIPGVSDISTLRMIKRPSTGGPWTAPGTPGTNSGTTSTPIVARSGLSGFSQFAIGSDGSNTLPVNLVSFSGQPAGNNITLSWTTSGQVTNQSFIVGHSTDGSSFTDLATVAANDANVAGNDATGLQQSYQYTQSTAPAGANYYRLQLVAPDGQSTFSSIISVTNTASSSSLAWSLYPNPASAVLNIVVPGVSPSSPSATGPTSAAAGATSQPVTSPTASPTSATASFELYDNSGRFLRILGVGTNDISPLAPGLYFVRSQQQSLPQSQQQVLIFIKK